MAKCTPICVKKHSLILKINDYNSRHFSNIVGMYLMAKGVVLNINSGNFPVLFYPSTVTKIITATQSEKYSLVIQ